MFKKHVWRKIIVACSLSGLMAVADHAAAQWGTNTTPCPGHCGPASPWWGYVQTRWTRWPGANYPDMVKPPATNSDEIPVPGVDLPTPSKESDIRSAPQSANTKSQNTGSATDTAPSETPTEPAQTQPPESKQSDMPGVQDAPGATPPEQPFFTPPSTPPSAPAATPPVPAEPGPAVPSNNSGTLPAPRLHAPVSRQNAAIIENNNNQYAQQPIHESNAPAVAKPLRLRIDVDDFSRPISSSQEPERIVPSPSGRPLNAQANQAVQSSAAGNPLRTDYGQNSVVVTSAVNTNSSNGQSYQQNPAEYPSSPTTYQR